MTKKIIIAVVAVVVALAVINFTWLGSHARSLWRSAVVNAERKVPLDYEIKRLEMEIDNLKSEKDRLFDEMLRRGVEVKKLEVVVKADQAKLAQAEKSIYTMKESLQTKGEYVNYLEKSFKRDVLQDDLRRLAANFRLDEKTIQSKEEQLALKRRAYENHRKVYGEIELARQEMMTELERLKTEFAREQELQASESKTVATPGFERVRKDMDRLKDRIEEIKMRRELKGDVDGPVRAHERRKKELEEIDSYLDKRFSEKN
jgi:hypothetical protein